MITTEQDSRVEGGVGTPKYNEAKKDSISRRGNTDEKRERGT